MRRSPVCVLMFPTQLLKGRWYYSASVFALWTLSSPELTLHQISGLGCYEASAEIFALGRAPFSLNRLRGLLMHFYIFMCRTIFQWRQAGMKGQKQRMITCKKKKKNRRTIFEPGHKPSQFRPSGDVLLFAQNSASQKESYHRS